MVAALLMRWCWPIGKSRTDPPKAGGGMMRRYIDPVVYSFLLNVNITDMITYEHIYDGRLTINHCYGSHHMAREFHGMFSIGSKARMYHTSGLM
jgi:hypothetical protein